MSKPDLKLIQIDAQTVEIIANVHCFFNDTKRSAAWMNTKNLNLGGCSPVDLIFRGRGKKVLEFIINAIDSNKPAKEVK